MLDGGRFDIAVVTSAINSAPLKEVGTVVAPKLASVQAFHLVHKNNADLAAKWDAILVAMKKDGRFAKLLTAH